VDPPSHPLRCGDGAVPLLPSAGAPSPSQSPSSSAAPSPSKSYTSTRPPSPSASYNPSGSAPYVPSTATPSGLSGGAKAGIAVGTIAGVAAIAGVIFFVRRRGTGGQVRVWFSIYVV
jgi:hypothetical protein